MGDIDGIRRRHEGYAKRIGRLDFCWQPHADRGTLLKMVAELEAEKNTAARKVFDAGLATGHADTVVDLVDEVLGQYAELQAEREAVRQIAIEGMDDYAYDSADICMKILSLLGKESEDG